MAHTLYGIFLMVGLTSTVAAMDNPDVERLFHHAIKSGKLPVVKCLVARGVNVDAFTIKYLKVLDVRPLQIAVQEEYPLIVDELLRAGARANVSNSYTGESLLHTALYSILAIKADTVLSAMQQINQNMQVIELLLSKGADFAALRRDRASLFHVCALHFRDSKRRYPLSLVCGRSVYQQLVRSVCITQGALLDVVFNEDAKESQDKLSQVIEKLRILIQQKNSTGETAADIFCEGTPGCRGGYHPIGCAAHVTVLDAAFVERLKKETIE